MKRIIINNQYTYETDLKNIRKGTALLLPTPHWLTDVLGATWVGKVTSLSSNYDGPCSKVIGRAP